MAGPKMTDLVALKGMPTFSVIIPTCNREKFVAKAIESALNQSFN